MIFRADEGPTGTRYALVGTDGFIEAYDTGRIIGVWNNYREWHQFETVSAAKEWLLLQHAKARLLS